MDHARGGGHRLNSTYAVSVSTASQEKRPAVQGEPSISADRGVDHPAFRFRLLAFLLLASSPANHCSVHFIASAYRGRTTAKSE